MSIRIILADDHHVVRRGVRQVLEQEADLEVIAEAGHGHEVLELLESGLKADVLLTDLNMPEMDGIQLTKEIISKYPGLQVVLLTIVEEECHVQHAFREGIKSYIFKTADPEELVYAVRQVARGKMYLCSGLSEKVIGQIISLAGKTNATPNVDFSERELDVLRLIAEGYTNEEAADKLFTSRRTVEGHRQSMIDKTGSRNSLALVRYAVQHGLVN